MSDCVAKEVFATSEVDKPAEPSLSDEQLVILNKVQQGENIFITGSAGVGKSFALKEVIKSLPQRTTYVTASTGVAACNISGITLHSFAGIGLGDGSVSVLLGKVRTRREARNRWLNCRTLVIDEVSMIDGELFQKIEKIARMIRDNDFPFGGIQLILCGDFLQLPPVANYNEKKQFCFQVPAWKRCIKTTVLLKKVFRQKDEALIAMLNRIRMGELCLKDSAQLQKCKFTKFNDDDDIKPTKLFPHRASCDDVNNKQLALLPGKPYSYESDDNALRGDYKQQLDKYSRFPKKLSLKVGAQVMLLKNLDVASGLVNGSRGVVTDFVSPKVEALKDLAEDDPILQAQLQEMQLREEQSNKIYPVVRFANGRELVIQREKNNIEIAGKEVASREQLPLALAWAVSIHKSQGMTIERVELSLGQVFEYGQAYVALSRCTSISGLKVSDFKSSVVKSHPQVLAYYECLVEGKELPAESKNSIGVGPFEKKETSTPLRGAGSLGSRPKEHDTWSTKFNHAGANNRPRAYFQPQHSVASNHFSPGSRNFGDRAGVSEKRDFKGLIQDTKRNTYQNKLFTTNSFSSSIKRPHCVDVDSEPQLKARKTGTNNMGQRHKILLYPNCDDEHPANESKDDVIVIS